MIPVARTEKLLIQEVGNELVVYDQETNASHCLTSVAASVWHHCDGQNTVEDIAQLLEKELNIPADSGVDIRGLVYLSLEELERNRLIQQYLREPVAVSTISRRKMVKTATLVGGFAIGSMFPLVKSIMAPDPAMAVSPTVSPTVCDKLQQDLCPPKGCPEGQGCFTSANNCIRSCEPFEN
jgi:hypothetical protein